MKATTESIVLVHGYGYSDAVQEERTSQLKTCFSATTPAFADGSLFDGLAHLGLRTLGGAALFEINPCRIDAKLTRSMHDAIVKIGQLEENHALCPIRASERFVAAEAAWVEHKLTCRFCRGQEFGKVH